VYLYDQSGKQYLDGSGGAAVSCLGHGDVDVTNAIKAQLDKVAYAHTSFFTSEPAEQLAATLIEHAPKDIERVYLVSGGSEAVESAMKLARQYFWEQGQTQRRHFIARRQSYHGNTLAALAAGGNEWRREPFSPLMLDTSHIAPCFEYRGKQHDETVQQYGLRVANELDQKIRQLGAENVIAFMAETVVGATSGAVPAVDGYFKRIRQICDEHGILLILDEVMCGMGRTGSLFACEQEAIAPDIITIAKGLGAGYQPIGAMLCSADIYDALQARFAQHPHIGDIRGRGLFRALEIVQDRETKTPFAPDKALHKKIKKAAFDAGLICYPMGGTINGVDGDHVLLAPPFIIDNSHIDEMVSKLMLAFDQSFD